MRFAAAHVAFWTRWTSADCVPVPIKRCGTFSWIFSGGGTVCIWFILEQALVAVLRVGCGLQLIGMRKRGLYWCEMFRDSSPWLHFAGTVKRFDRCFNHAMDGLPLYLWSNM
jgi:hypothetical protein